MTVLALQHPNFQFEGLIDLPCLAVLHLLARQCFSINKMCFTYRESSSNRRLKCLQVDTEFTEFLVKRNMHFSSSIEEQNKSQWHSEYLLLQLLIIPHHHAVR